MMIARDISFSFCLVFLAKIVIGYPLHTNTNIIRSMQQYAPYKEDGSNSITTDRRTYLAQQITALSTLSIIGSHRPPANAAEVDVITQLQNSLEERLANSNTMSPSYGMEISDIFYPSSFQGSWNVLSKTVDIIAPCGYELFTGGEKGYQNAVKEITDRNNDLRYRARFIPSGDEDGTCIADREYVSIVLVLSIFLHWPICNIIICSSHL